MKKVSAVLAIFLTIIAAVVGSMPLAYGQSSPLASPDAKSSSSREKHVFIIILENKGFDETFGPKTNAPYLAHTLRSRGELLTNYYAIGHLSLDNYIAIISGEAPNPETQADCTSRYSEFSPVDDTFDSDGQISGKGCIYPPEVLTITDQLDAKGLNWRGYMEDMSRPCEHPQLNQPDDHVHAVAGDQYATRHDPFVYFHSIIDNQQRCDEHVVPLVELDTDLSKVENTPNLVFITPNLCNDGHDGPSSICAGGGLISSDQFLHKWVPKILASPAYEQAGILIITFDEAEVGVIDNQIDPATTDARSCCNEPSGPNTQNPGLVGPGGGRVGAVMLSPYIKASSTNDTPYNHYSLLRGLEDVFGLEHLGYAQKPKPTPFNDLLDTK